MNRFIEVTQKPKIDAQGNATGGGPIAIPASSVVMVGTMPDMGTVIIARDRIVVTDTVAEVVAKLNGWSGCLRAGKGDTCGDAPDRREVAEALRLEREAMRVDIEELEGDLIKLYWRIHNKARADGNAGAQVDAAKRLREVLGIDFRIRQVVPKEETLANEDKIISGEAVVG